MRTTQYVTVSSGRRPRCDIEVNKTRGAVFAMLVCSLPALCLLYFVWSIYREMSSALAYPASMGLVDLEHFAGSSECGISLADLYVFPKKNHADMFPKSAFCRNRKSLLEGLSGGGRHGFDAPYAPNGCHYRWYPTEEICMVLERFDSVVFIGDDSLQTIYKGFNILLRKDLATGAIDPSALQPGEMATCRCESQFTKESCSKAAITASDQISTTHHNPYVCPRIPHAFLPISGSSLSSATLKSLSSLVPRAPPSNYHPIPIIFSVTPSSPLSTALASETLDELISFVDATERKTPILWIGPTAAGHLHVRGRVGNHEIWQFSTEMDRVAKEKDVESLGMWNMTVQADSWDGRMFSERVALVQAMMVVNWLSKLESS